MISLLILAGVFSLIAKGCVRLLAKISDGPRDPDAPKFRP